MINKTFFILVLLLIFSCVEKKKSVIVTANNYCIYTFNFVDNDYCKACACSNFLTNISIETVINEKNLIKKIQALNKLMI